MNRKERKNGQGAKSPGGCESCLVGNRKLDQVHLLFQSPPKSKFGREPDSHANSRPPARINTSKYILVVVHSTLDQKHDVQHLEMYVYVLTRPGLLHLTLFPIDSQTARQAATRALHTQTQPITASSTSSAISLLRSQPSQYVVASVVGRKYLLSPRDLLTVPRLKDVNVGDVLHLSEVHEVGSRDYTIRGNPVISPEKVRVEATVVEHTKGKMEVIFKKKRRKGYQKTIKHKQTYTRLRIGSIEVADQSE